MPDAALRRIGDRQRTKVVVDARNEAAIAARHRGSRQLAPTGSKLRPVAQLEVSALPLELRAGRRPARQHHRWRPCQRSPPAPSLAKGLEGAPTVNTTGGGPARPAVAAGIVTCQGDGSHRRCTAGWRPRSGDGEPP
jgi:hypothetical protein